MQLGIAREVGLAALVSSCPAIAVADGVNLSAAPGIDVVRAAES